MLSRVVFLNRSEQGKIWRCLCLMSVLVWMALGVSHAQPGRPGGLGGPGGGEGGQKVKWHGDWRRVDSARVVVRLVAEPQGDWHIYSTNLPKGGPSATRFSFEGDTLRYRVEGKVAEKGNALDVKDEQWGLTLRQYDDSVEFTHELSLLDAEALVVRCQAEYQICSHSACDFQDEEFALTIEPGGQGGKVLIGAEVAGAVAESKESSAPLEVKQLGDLGAQGNALQEVEAAEQGQQAKGSNWLFFLVTFLAGLAGLLTPCVFPMIPLTVSYFLNKKGRFNAILNALVFGLSITAIYTLLGLVVSLSSLGADFIVDITTHWITNLIFFALFVFFAAAFFSVFEMRLPGSIGSKADAEVDKQSGLLGSFFLALTTVIVSLSCVGPIVGTLLVESVSGPAIRPVVGMFAFGLGFSIPFTIFALFPRLLDKLPKSGGWMNSVKIVLGFVVLGFSLKFLLLMDMSLGWGLLSRNLFLAIWVVLAFLLGAYLMGWVRFKMDSPMQHVGFFRMLLAGASFTFALMLLPGIFGAPLQGLSGILPEYRAEEYAWQGSGAQGAGASSTAARWSLAGQCAEPQFQSVALPAGLQGYRTWDEAKACAAASGRNVLVEFTGHGCANCKEMTAKVLSDARVQTYIDGHYVYAALYVDDKAELPAPMQYTSPLDGKQKTTLGRMNQDVQKRLFKSSGQPQFFVVTPEGDVLRGPLGRELDVDKFLDFISVQ